MAIDVAYASMVAFPIDSVPPLLLDLYKLVVACFVVGTADIVLLVVIVAEFDCKPCGKTLATVPAPFVRHHLVEFVMVAP